MRYLLDTHVFLWLRSEPEKLRRPARERLASAESALSLSVVSAWEMAVKQAAGRLVLPGAARTWMPLALAEAHCDMLPLEFEHAMDAARLPPEHGDPFDRLIVGQARIEGLTLVTSDKRLFRYDVEIMRA